MKFNDTTNNTGICQDVWFLTGTSSSSFSVSDIARITNKVLRELSLRAWALSSNWKFDDRNHPTLNIAECSLIDGVSDYQLATTDFDVQLVEIRDVNGNYHKLEPIREREAIDKLSGEKGIPTHYFFRGSSIFVVSRPNTNFVSYLRIYLSRDISEFTATDTTKEPGLPTILHPIIPFMVAMEYAGTNNLPSLNFFNKKVIEWKEIFDNYFINRGEEVRKRFVPKYQNFE